MATKHSLWHVNHYKPVVNSGQNIVLIFIWYSYFLAEWRPGKCKDEQSKIPIKKIKLDNEGKFGNGLDDCENLCSEQPLATACEYNTQTNECFYHTKTISTASEDQTDKQFMCSIIQKKGLL